jgi:hypothetical protein
MTHRIGVISIMNPIFSQRQIAAAAGWRRGGREETPYVSSG